MQMDPEGYFSFLVFLPALVSVEDTVIDEHARQIMQRHSAVTLLLPVRVANITLLRRIGQNF